MMTSLRSGVKTFNRKSWQIRCGKLVSADDFRALMPQMKGSAMITGSLPALVTPFENGKVDVDALKKLVDWHIDQGSNGLVPVGTTGESPTLTHEEHDMVVKLWSRRRPGRVPVIAGAGSNNTAETVRLVKAAKEAGATAALVVTPYYNKPTQAGLKAHFPSRCGLRHRYNHL
jgi:4-hydroxy-tetrahydrodipicolinate synthase